MWACVCEWVSRWWRFQILSTNGMLSTFSIIKKTRSRDWPWKNATRRNLSLSLWGIKIFVSCCTTLWNSYLKKTLRQRKTKKLILRLFLGCEILLMLVSRFFCYTQLLFTIFNPYLLYGFACVSGVCVWLRLFLKTVHVKTHTSIRKFLFRTSEY